MSDDSRFLKALGVVALSSAGGVFLVKKLVNYVSDRILYDIMTKVYDANLWELATATQRFGINDLVETELRAHAEDFINRPIGGPRKFRFLQRILFDIAQMNTLPTPKETIIDTSVVIGPRARKPMELEIPILIGGMAYGLALSEAYRIAIAKGSALAGTATNTGLGPFITAERKAAKYLIIQYSRVPWNKDKEILRQGDAIEVQFGQGANAGVGRIMRSREIGPVLRRRMGLKKEQDAIVQNRLDGVNSPTDLRRLIKRLKAITSGVPVGVKYGAGKHIERDLAIAVKAGADFISVDGAEAGTHGSLPIMEDNFGIPTLIAAARAAKFWEKHRLKNKVSLLVGGGLTTPGDVLKILGLGADAVYMGTAPLFAATHTQVLKSLPYNPPPQLAYYDGKDKKKFKIEEGAKSLARFLNWTVFEIEEGVRALGKTAIRDVCKDDMMTYDEEVAQITGVHLAFYPPTMLKPLRP